jgi:hypothetical protein
MNITRECNECIGYTAQYFKYFNEKNLTKLSELYFFGITLEDWVGRWVGAEEVLEMNSNLFQNEIEILVNSIHVGIDVNMNMIKTISDITIHINGETINAIDELMFTSDFKIYNITARKK